MIIRFLLGASAVILLTALPNLTGFGSTHETRIESLAPGTVPRVPSREPRAESRERPFAGFATVPPKPWGEAGPADSLYRLGREGARSSHSRRARAAGRRRVRGGCDAGRGAEPAVRSRRQR